jgi:threonine aldolase
MDYIDFRSDTVTWPTPEMREAMANAPVGDDVFGDDPTVIELENEAAARLGKEAALFMASGTMSNAVALLTHCGRGDEVILGRQAHTFVSEAGGSAALGGIHPNALEVQTDGTLALDRIRESIRSENDHHPRTRLICLENTQGLAGGIPISAAYTEQVGAIARENGLKLHIDGARIFNAAAALGVDVRELAAPADSVSFCLSNGLCAPVGSLLVGSKAFIKEARRTRKMLGGGMRQVGILAAAGLIALRKMPERLHIDHENACALAEGLAQNPYIRLDLSKVQTNIIFFELADGAPIEPKALGERLKAEHKILLPPLGHSRRFRAVTHYWITREDVQHTLDAMWGLLA